MGYETLTVVGIILIILGVTAWSRRLLSLDQGSLTTRKPRLKPRSYGACVYLKAQRALSAPKYQLPPRITRLV